MRDRRLRNNSRADDIGTITYMLALLALLHSFGLPGEYAKVFGSMLETLFKYATLLAQLVCIIFTSANNVMDLTLFSAEKKYWPVYFFVISFFLVSMMGTNYRKREIVFCLNLGIHALFAIWLSGHFSVRRFLQLVYHAQILFIAASIIYPVMFHRYYYNAAREGVFLGCLGIKNESAAELSFGVLMQLLLLRVKMDRRETVSFGFIGFLLLQCVLLLLAHGMGALICTAIPVFYLFFIEPRKDAQHRLPLAYIYIVVSIGYLVFALTIIQMAAPLLESLGKDATLTGRTITWDGVIRMMQGTHTMTGFGFNMFWEDHSAVAIFHSMFDAEKNPWHTTMADGAHNDLMELWLNVGLLGIAAYFFTLLSALKRPERWSRHQYILITGFILWLTIYGLNERSFFTKDFRTLFLLLTLAVGCGTAKDEELAQFR